MAWQSGAVERWRGFPSPDVLLRTLLLHVAKGYSLRETVVRAKLANWTDISDVALLKRLRNSEQWLRCLCIELLPENVAYRLEEGISRTIRMPSRRPPFLAHNFRVADNRELGIVQIGFRWKLDGSREIGFTNAKWCSSPARAMRTSSRRTGSHTAAKECRRIPCAPPELVQHNVRLGCSE